MAFGPFKRFFSRKSVPAEEVTTDVNVDELFDAAEAPLPEVAPEAPQSTRVKTTFLGFDAGADISELDDIEDDEPEDAAPEQVSVQFPTGWLAIVEGPGRGHSFALSSGVNSIGRSEDQQISLDFGDTNISREGHCFVAFDEDEEAFFAGQGGKSNLVRLNGQPLLSTERMEHGDQVKVGQTVLRLIALCDADFSWREEE